MHGQTKTIYDWHMTRPSAVFKFLFAAIVCSVTSLGVAGAGPESERLEDLFAELQAPDLPNWEAVETQIWEEWSKSGSPAMDLLLDRGRKAMEAGDVEAAIEHFSALTDHAPEFAEGWNARATAFYQAEEFGLSMADIERTLALNPRHFGALTGLAAILEQLGQPEAALNAYKAARSIHPHRPDVEEAINRLERDLGGVTL